MTLLVVDPGPNATIQDLGRPGWFSIGVGVAGAADRTSFMLANRLVGNDDRAAAIECVLGGLHLVAQTSAAVAVTGAPAPVTIDSAPAEHSTLLHLLPGQHLRIGLARVGLRVYVAVRGGIDVAPVLGSRSRDTLAGIGPEPLAAGVSLPIGTSIRALPPPPIVVRQEISGDTLTVRTLDGPRADWFTRPDDLYTGHWTVGDRLDRVGIRLDRPTRFPSLTRAVDAELPTEGMPLGAIQIPPSGEPVVFLADHPITGGYPVVAVVVSDDIPKLAQARPGQHIVFRRASSRPAIRFHGNPSPDDVAAILVALGIATRTDAHIVIP